MSTTTTTTTKPKVKKAVPTHPKYREMVVAAIGTLKERNGSSRQAIMKYVQANYKVSEGSRHIKLALKKAVLDQVLIQTKGTGASGSFKLAAKPAKKATAKKATVARKPASKKTPKKTAVKKAPKKKSSAKKAPKKKPAAKKPVAKKVTKKKPAKKTPKKKAAAKK